MKNQKKSIVLASMAIGMVLVLGSFLYNSYEKKRIQFVPESPSMMIQGEKPNNEPYRLGNTVGNMNGGSGHAAISGDWIYYKNVVDENKIHKIKYDGTGKRKLCDDSAYGINISDGWIYYYTVTDPEKLYRIDENGENREVILPKRITLQKIMGDWIYYIHPWTDTTTAERKSYSELWKVKVDGTEDTLLCSEYCENFTVSEGDIYCSIKESQNGIDEGTYLIDTNGNIVKKIDDDRKFYMNIIDDWMYFSNASDNRSLYKMKTDGSDKEKLVDEHTSFVNVTDGWIYYSAENQGRCLYKIRTDGSEKQKLNDEQALFISIIGEKILYMNKAGDVSLTWDPDIHNIVVNLDGTDRKELR